MGEEEEEEEEEEPVVHLMSVDVNIEDNNGWTPMHAAAWNSIAIQVYRYILFIFFIIFVCFQVEIYIEILCS